MGMSTHVVGVVPPDSKWTKMKDAYDACKTAGVAVPQEVFAFFNGESPDPKGVVLDKDDLDGAVSDYATDYQQGFEVDLSKLPKHVKSIRFYNSY